MARTDLAVVISGDERKAWAALQRIIKQEKALGQAAADGGKKSRQASKQATGGMQNLAGAVFKGTLAYGGLTLAIGKATAAVKALDAAREAAAERARGAEAGLASLAQLAGGDPAKLQRLMAGARDIYRRGGAETMAGAARTMFALESAGAAGQRGFFADLFGIVPDVAMMARAATTMQTAIGKAEAGNLRQIVSKALAASKHAPATVEALLEAGARGGVSAEALRISDEELLAATALMSKATGTAELGGTTVAALLTAMQRLGGFGGLGLMGGIEKLGAMGLTEQQMVKLLGRKEAYRAFGVLGRMGPEMAMIQADMLAAQEQDLAGRVIGTVQRDPFLGGLRRERIARARRELGVANIERGRERVLTERMIQERVGFVEEEPGVGALITSKILEAGLRLERLFGGEGAFVREWGTPGEIAEYNRTMAEDTKVIRENTRPRNVTLGKPDEDR